MDESQLTRKAIEEIVRELNERKEEDARPRVERKVNPLGKPNKRFLGRTINSILVHNKREDTRTLRNCKQKLRELDGKHKRIKHNGQYTEPDERRRRRTKKSYEKHSKTLGKSKSKRKHKKRKKRKSERKRSTSRSSSSRSRSGCRSKSSSSSCSSATGNREYTGKYRDNYAEYVDTELSANQYYMEPSADINTMALAAAAYQQYFQQMLLANAFSSVLTERTELPKVSELNENFAAEIDAISEDKTCSSFSSLEEDENGILTINVSSDEEIFRDNETNSKKRRKRRRNSTTEYLTFDLNTSSSSACADEEISVHSCVLLDSDTELVAADNIEQNNSIQNTEIEPTDNKNNTIDLTDE